MKKNLVIILSLVANAALLAAVWLRPNSTSRPAPPAAAGQPTAPTASSPLAPREAPPTDQELAAIRTFRKLHAAANKSATPTSGSDTPYWHRGGALGLPSREEMAESNRLRREFSDAMRAAFGSDAMTAFQGKSRFNFLSSAKQEQLSRILQDYSELQAEIVRDMNNIQLPSDRAKLKLLREEQEKDIAALLSPQELEQYELRASRSADNIRNRYGQAIASEEDYRKIFALQKDFDAKFPMEDLVGARTNPDYFRLRSEAEQQLQNQIRTALGDEKYADFRRASDQEHQALATLTSRLNLPPSATTSVLAARDSYALESQRIQADPNLSPQDRRTQIQALAERAKTQVASTLGSEATEAYAPRAQWLNYLKGGTAFSTNPKDAPPGLINMSSSVYPVMPAGVRTTVTTTTSADGAPVRTFTTQPVPPPSQTPPPSPTGRP